MPLRQSKTPRLRSRKLATLSQDISTSPAKESTRGVRSPKTPGWVSGSKAVFRTPSLSPLSPPKRPNTRRSSVFTKKAVKVPQLTIKADVHTNSDGRKLAVFKVPKSTSPPAKPSVQTSNRRTSVYKKTKLNSFNISLSPRTATLMSPPGVKTRARRSSVYQKIRVNLVDIDENIDSPVKSKTKEVKKTSGKAAKKASPVVQSTKTSVISPVMRRSQKRKMADVTDSPAQVKRARTSSKAQSVGVPTVTKEEKVAEVQELKSNKVKTPIKKTPARKTPVEKTPTGKTPVEKTPARKTPVTKTPTRKTPARKTPVRKTPARKTPVTKTPTRKTPVKKTPGRQANVLVQSKASSPTSVEKEKPLVAQTQIPVKTPKKQTVTPISSNKGKRKVSQGNSTPSTSPLKKLRKTNTVKTPATKKATPVSKTPQKNAQVSTPKPVVRLSVTKTKTPLRAAEKLGFEKAVISPLVTAKNTSNKRKSVKVKSPPSSSGKRLRTPKTLPKTPVPKRKLTPARITETRNIRQEMSRKIIESPVGQPQDEMDIQSVSMNTSAMNDSLLSTSRDSLNTTYSHSSRCIIL